MIILAGWLRGAGGCPGNPSISHQFLFVGHPGMIPIDPFVRARNYGLFRGGGIVLTTVKFAIGFGASVGPIFSSTLAPLWLALF
jgi:hypothetical protein